LPKILIVEDDQNLSLMLQSALKAEHFVVDLVTTGEEAVERLSFYSYDLAIIDWILPGLSGLDVCRQYREKGGLIPILILTGKSKVREIRAGLDSGSDDYLTKPFDMEELSARVRALLRRPVTLKATVLTVGDLVLDVTAKRATKSGVEVHLTPKEFAVLELLMRHPNQPFSAETLIERIWSSESETSPESIRPFMFRLREKIETGGPPVIETMRGQGYKLVISS
jgi:DNA-binding response OmpR family regulator